MVNGKRNSSSTRKSRTRIKGGNIRTALHGVFSTRLEGAAFHLADSGKPSEALIREMT